MQLTHLLLHRSAAAAAAAVNRNVMITIPLMLLVHHVERQFRLRVTLADCRRHRRLHVTASCTAENKESVQPADKI